MVTYHLVRNFLVFYYFFGVSTLRVPRVRTYVGCTGLSRIFLESAEMAGTPQNSVQPNSLRHKLAYKMDMYNAV
jgi:hypothetical protein